MALFVALILELEASQNISRWFLVFFIEVWSLRIVMRVINKMGIYQMSNSLFHEGYTFDHALTHPVKDEMNKGVILPQHKMSIAKEILVG